MTKFRLSVAFLLLALVLAVVPAAFAQDSTFGASEEDFALWTAANTALGASSASFDFTATLTMTGMGEGDNSADISGTGVFDLSDPENPVFQLDATGSMTEDGETETQNLNLVVTGGYIYTNTGDGWEQRKIDEALGSLSEEAGLPDMGSVDPSDLSANSPLGMLGDLDVDEFISLERSDDSGDAKFSFSIDIPGLLSSPALLPLVMGGMMGGGADTPEMTDEQLEQMSQMMGMMFGEAELTFDEYVNPDTQVINRAVFNFALPLGALLGSEDAGISLNFDVNFTGHGEPVNVEAPEGATMVTDS